MRIEDSAKRTELGVVSGKDRENFVIDVRRGQALENALAPGFQIEHPHDVREQRSAAHKRIIGVARIHIIREHVKPHGRFKLGPELRIARRDRGGRAALRVLQEHVFRIC